MVICGRMMLLGLVFLASSEEDVCPTQCKCTVLTAATLQVDCSSRDMDNLPMFPDSTEELFLQQNQLTTVPPGAFDNLKNLKKLNLSSNPLHCDCRIQYLNMWLYNEKVDVDNSALCLTPPSLYGKPVAQIAGNQFAACAKSPKLCSDFLVNDAFLFAFLCLLLVLMILCLKTFKTMKFKLEVTDNDINFETDRTWKLGLIKRRSHYCVKSS